jgi:phosphoadenosine phosphosulfate reductase
MTATSLAPRPHADIGENTPAAEFIAWTLERFRNERIVLTTSFGMEGCALIDMYARVGQPLDVVYLDTMFLFPDTYALRDRMIERYPHLRFVNRGTTLTPETQAVEHGPELWRANPEECCRLRKVEPMREVLAEADVWITGITRSQSAARAVVRRIEWDWQFQLIKISPLADWDRERVWEYVQREDVPYNPLHTRGYPSIGCTHCTVPVTGARVSDYSRAGRWAGSEKTECGLHNHGSGI